MHTGDTNSLDQCRQKHRYQLNTPAASQKKVKKQTIGENWQLKKLKANFH